MYSTTDESSSDDDDNAVDSDDGEVCVSESQTTHPCPLLVEPPQVLEPSHYIMKVPGPRRECFGYRICGDNIDKNVRARYMRSDKKNLSLHYFHSYAVLNRIDASSFSDTVPDTSNLNVDVVANSLLPSPSDDIAIRGNIAKLISRVLVENLEYFKFAFEDVIDWHIEHPFYGEMSQQSVMVSSWLYSRTSYFDMGGENVLIN